MSFYVLGTDGQIKTTSPIIIGGPPFGILEDNINEENWPILSSTINMPSFTTGSVIFSGPNSILSQSNANLFWDNVNKRLGIGTIPNAKLELINGTIRALDGSATVPTT